MKTPSQDLNSLINAAQDEAVRNENQPHPDRSHQRNRGKTLLRAGLAAAGLIFATIQLWPLARPHSTEQTARDLDVVIEQAQKAVEAARTEQGALPDALPNAALAGLVAFTPVGNNYQLFAASGKVSVTRGTDGSKTVSKGE
jgi:hypothetical protein